MGQKGYLYVLANSSIPNLVKVGKTTRVPESRAQELSGSTSVPTPFIVVFERYFQDCDAAEEYVHTLLSRKGYRLSENREFFRAPSTDVIIAIMSAPGGLDTSPNPIQELEDKELFQSHASDEMDTWSLESHIALQPWEEVLEEADRYYYGLGDYVQDYQEAMSLYKQAARLGALAAYERLGDMCRYGEAVPEDNLKALEYYKEGVRKGNYYCYLPMGELFKEDGNVENFEKCVRLFFQKSKDLANPVLDKDRAYPKAVLRYMQFCRWRKRKYGYEAEIGRIRDDILRLAQEHLNYLNRVKRNPLYVQQINDIVSWLEQLQPS